MKLLDLIKNSLHRGNAKLHYRVYADAAAATPLSGRVQKEMHRLEKLYGNPGGLHNEATAAKNELEHARERAAGAIGAHADEIFFTSGGTEANNLAIFGALRALLHEHGELNAVTTTIEHPSVLEPLRALEREGLYVTYLEVDEHGLVDPKALREAVNDETVFVSVQMVNSEIGTIQNIREAAKEVRNIRRRRMPQARALKAARPSLTLASRHASSDLASQSSFASLSLYFHSDASQAPLWLKLNVEKLGIDMLTLDAQKMMGPKSSGLLYVRRGTELEPIIFGGGQEQGLRSGTENAVLAGAIAETLVEAQESCEKNAQHVAGVRDYLWSEVQRLIPEVVLNGPSTSLGTTQRVANNLNISIPNLDGQMAVIALNAKGVAASTRSACSTGEVTASHVLQAIGADDALAQSAIRISLLPNATINDAKTIVRALKNVVKRYRLED